MGLGQPDTVGLEAACECRRLGSIRFFVILNTFSRARLRTRSYPQDNSRPHQPSELKPGRAAAVLRLVTSLEGAVLCAKILFAGLQSGRVAVGYLRGGESFFLGTVRAPHNHKVSREKVALKTLKIAAAPTPTTRAWRGGVCHCPGPGHFSGVGSVRDNHRERGVPGVGRKWRGATVRGPSPTPRPQVRQWRATALFGDTLALPGSRTPV